MEAVGLAQKRIRMENVNECVEYKHPRVSCFRDFPKGCGTKHAPVMVAAIESTNASSEGFFHSVAMSEWSPVVLEHTKPVEVVVKSEELSDTSLLKDVRPVTKLGSSGRLEVGRPELDIDLMNLISKPFSMYEQLPSGRVKNAVCDDLQEYRSNLSYPRHDFSNAEVQIQPLDYVLEASCEQPPKKCIKRKISAVETLPSRCGQNHLVIGKDECGEVGSSVQHRRMHESKLEKEDLKDGAEICRKKKHVKTKVLARKAGGLISSSEEKFLVSKKSEYQEKHEANSCIKDQPILQMGKYPECNANLPQHDEIVARERVRDTMRLFQTLCRKFMQEDKSVNGKCNRIDFRAFDLMKKKALWLAEGQQHVGKVPGIEIGDEFHYRMELRLVGLHRFPMAGIDYKLINGRLVATCVVSSGGYSDVMDNSDVLIYEGQGGHPDYQRKAKKPAGDQKLTKGNLALKNSIDAGLPVRVIHGLREQSASSDSRLLDRRLLATYVYDGLYKVEKYWSEPGRQGFSVFKFWMRRMPGQLPLAMKEVFMLKQVKERQGLCMNDISNCKEKRAITAVNTIDNELPVPFRYSTKMIYPSWHKPRPSRGCNCVGVCKDSQKCACAAKNGGEFPFNYDRAIVRAKPLVYECGPSCRCPPSCYNRVSQHGIPFQLEIFKTKSCGWGVRSLASIPSGSFVCEYTGELLEDSEAEKRTNDEYLFDIGKNYNDESLWEGLLKFMPDLQEDVADANVDDTGFTIDAVKYGSVARFINHSCSPNLYAQNVLYDHDDKSMPHIMLFAAENIPPLKELTYHYNYTIDKVYDLNGNVKKKACSCGSAGCTGWLY